MRAEVSDPVAALLEMEGNPFQTITYRCLAKQLIRIGRYNLSSILRTVFL